MIAVLLLGFVLGVLTCLMIAVLSDFVRAGLIERQPRPPLPICRVVTRQERAYRADLSEAQGRDRGWA